NHKIKSLLGELNMLQFYLDAQHKLTEQQKAELSTAKQQIKKLRRSKSASFGSGSAHKKSHHAASTGKKPSES
ncbi:hypothetical protein RRG08_014929, partial [Elysia crispata]